VVRSAPSFARWSGQRLALSHPSERWEEGAEGKDGGLVPTGELLAEEAIPAELLEALALTAEEVEAFAAEQNAKEPPATEH